MTVTRAAFTFRSSWVRAAVALAIVTGTALTAVETRQARALESVPGAQSPVTVAAAAGQAGWVLRDGHGREVTLRGFNVSGSTKLYETSLLPFRTTADAARSAQSMRDLTGANVDPVPDQLGRRAADARQRSTPPTSTGWPSRSGRSPTAASTCCSTTTRTCTPRTCSTRAAGTPATARPTWVVQGRRTTRRSPAGSASCGARTCRATTRCAVPPVRLLAQPDAHHLGRSGRCAGRLPHPGRRRPCGTCASTLPAESFQNILGVRPVQRAVRRRLGRRVRHRVGAHPI